ncbi:hypothetical protein BU25DRAFT_357968 [Macroventuria anomochaeta]|uniref:Uncharacterized protein n=1 Tax=Macroventuria anomochaeta TaxID=301207 RepID=A0ACB6SFI3_9PLEO|nr:uncharacterized protein BU25DRAFT_357968 [Macroventuria anomochaeta]KAF2632986.1 hypothetical protein BU25DRAFT_357968 [Macroventuria anomochaeta]
MHSRCCLDLYSSDDSSWDLCQSSADWDRSPSARNSRLRDPHIRCDRNLGWSIDWAVAYLVAFLDGKNSPDAPDRLKAIRKRATEFQHDGLLRELPYRIFNGLNETLFAGKLKGAVFLSIDSLESDVSGATYTHSKGPNADVKRISIVLNSDVLKYAEARDIVAILIHHMIHAYFLVACGPQEEEEVAYGRLGHGVPFGKILTAIKKLSKTNSRELTPLGFGHELGGLRYAPDEYNYPRKRQAKDHQDDDAWYCSHCHCDVEEIPNAEIDKWFNKVCKPLYDQPESVRSAEVQFLFGKKPTLVDSMIVDKYYSVSCIFDKAKTRFLKIHKDVPESTFMRFLEFLHTGSYSPDLPASSILAAVIGIGARKGPPIIQGSCGTTESPTLADVQFAKLDALMGFKECKAYALERMNTYGLMNEDPLAVLKEIYRGEIDQDLRAWARKFLIQTPSSASFEYLGLNTESAKEPPNLIKLLSDRWPYRARFLEAVEGNGVLEGDMWRALEELCAKSWGGVPGLTASNAILTSLRASAYGNGYSPDTLGLSLARPHETRGLTWPGSCQEVNIDVLERERRELEREKQKAREAQDEARAIVASAERLIANNLSRSLRGEWDRRRNTECDSDY